jgi:DNA end-binding protein Ku
LIETLSEDFNPKQYHDTFQDQLRELVQAKQKGKTVTEHSVPRRGKVINMMDALKKSLRETAETGKRRSGARGTVHTMRSAGKAS